MSGKNAPMSMAVRKNPGAEEKTLPVEIGRVTTKLRTYLVEDDPLEHVMYRRCAIVGSSGILLKYENGGDIDGHDMVFRFNSATTKGFEKHVGAKTTHRIANSRNYGFREYDGEAVVQHMRNEASLSKLFRKRRKHPVGLYKFNSADLRVSV